MRRYPGHGANAGQQFNVCVECGKTVPVTEGGRDADSERSESGEIGSSQTSARAHR